MDTVGVLKTRRTLLDSDDHDEEDDDDVDDDDEDDGIKEVDDIEGDEKAESNESESDDDMEEEDNIADAAIPEDMSREVKGTHSCVLIEVFCHATLSRVNQLEPLIQPFSSFAQFKLSRSVMASKLDSCLGVGRWWR